MKYRLFLLPLFLIGSLGYASPVKWTCDGLSVVDAGNPSTPLMGKFTATLEIPEGNNSAPVTFSWGETPLQGTLTVADRTVFSGVSYMIQLDSSDHLVSIKGVLTAARVNDGKAGAFVFKGVGIDLRETAYLYCILQN